MSEQETIIEILNVLVRGEEDRNKLFDKALKWFCFTLITVISVCMISFILLLNTLFVQG